MTSLLTWMWSLVRTRIFNHSLSGIYSHLWWCSGIHHWEGKYTHSDGLAWLCCYGSSICSLCVGALVVRAGLRVLGNTSGSEHSKAELYSSSHILQKQKHPDVPLGRFHSCKKAQRQTVNRGGDIGEGGRGDEHQHNCWCWHRDSVSRSQGCLTEYTRMPWNLFPTLPTTKCANIFIGGRELNVKPDSASHIQGSTTHCRAQLASEEFVVSHGT